MDGKVTVTAWDPAGSRVSFSKPFNSRSARATPESGRRT